MEHLDVVVIFFFILSIVFFIFGYLNKKQSDEGNASVHIAIGIVLVIVSLIVFLIMVNVNHMYENKDEETPFNVKYMHSYKS